MIPAIIVFAYLAVILYIGIFAWRSGPPSQLRRFGGPGGAPAVEEYFARGDADLTIADLSTTSHGRA